MLSLRKWHERPC